MFFPFKDLDRRVFNQSGGAETFFSIPYKCMVVIGEISSADSTGWAIEFQENTGGGYITTGGIISGANAEDSNLNPYRSCGSKIMKSGDRMRIDTSGNTAFEIYLFRLPNP